jgi:hypothetical protein
MKTNKRSKDVSVKGVSNAMSELLSMYEVFSNSDQGLVQLVSASLLSHQVLGSKPSLCRISAGVRLCFGYSLPQTPLVWEPLALGLPFLTKDITNLSKQCCKHYLYRSWHQLRF